MPRPMTRKQIAAQETAAAEASLAPKPQVNRSRLEATIRSCNASADQYEAAGMIFAAARAREIAARTAERLAELDAA